MISIKKCYKYVSMIHFAKPLIMTCEMMQPIYVLSPFRYGQPVY